MDSCTGSVQNQLNKIRYPGYGAEKVSCWTGGGGGDLKIPEQRGSVYFFGSEIWLKFTVLGEKKLFLCQTFLKLFFGFT